MDLIKSVWSYVFIISSKITKKNIEGDTLKLSID